MRGLGGRSLVQLELLRESSPADAVESALLHPSPRQDSIINQNKRLRRNAADYEML
jgi:hypothetical protein